MTNWLPEHLEDIVSLHNDLRVTNYLTSDGGVETREQAQKRFEDWADNFAKNRMGKLRVTLKSDDRFIGRAGFGIFDKTGEAEIGYALLPSYWGNGYAFEAAVGLRDWFFRETDNPHFLGFANVRNIASLQILKRIGMTPTHVGTDEDGHTSQFHIYHRETQHD